MDPYPPSLVAHDDHQRAIAWAQSQLPGAHAELVSESDWAVTYRLQQTDREAYLKLLPGQRRSQLPLIHRLSQAFPNRMPRVLDLDADRGWCLVASHGGHEPSSSAGDAARILRAMGDLQGRAARRAPLLEDLRPSDPRTALDELMGFLVPDANTTASGRTGAAAWIGAEAAQAYHGALQLCRDALQSMCMLSSRLPPTVAHGDLHTGNVAFVGRQVVFIDWDELSSGPAGLCLHGLTGSVTRTVLACKLMRDERPVPASLPGRELQAYVGTLERLGYASRAALLQALPGAAVAGLARFVASYGAFGTRHGAETVRGVLRRKLEDLMDLCDWLASQEPPLGLALAEHHEAHGRLASAVRLTQDRVARRPDDPALHVRLAQLLADQGDSRSADEALEAALALDPASTSAHLARAALRVDELKLSDAAQALQQSPLASSDIPEVAAMRARVQTLRTWQAAAQDPTRVPAVSLTDDERVRGALLPSTRRLIVALFHEHGVVQVDNVFSAQQIAHLQQRFAEQQAGYLHQPDREDVLTVGHRRYMLTMTLDDTFGDSGMVANGLYLPLMQDLLGSECILGAYTAVVSLPGSADQEPHKDHTPLFDELGWGGHRASFAAQVIVPLLELNDATGTTRVIKGSQRKPLRGSVAKLSVQDPKVPLGSCLLLDYSVAHYGRGNRSDQIRPILNLIYSRPWFRDIRNYHLQPPLRFGTGFFENAPPAVRRLVEWWHKEQLAVDMARR
jgi:tetratricopeptide (TPR) repeat protein